jgi:dTMP kinase
VTRSDGPRGLFVTLEGGEGAGKSTQLQALAERARALGIDAVTSREPGGTPLGERLREALLSSADGETDERAELLVFAASRAQLVAEVIHPALERGALVLCDRFADSTVAYQQYGRGLPAEVVGAAIEVATGGLAPDLTFLLDLDPEAGHQRAGGKDDYLERADGGFHERVRAGFQALAAAEPERWCVLDAAQPASEVTERAWNRLHEALQQASFA